MTTKLVGYTTGVFDMFHVGHLNILEKAKEQCDYLIVGVSTDELVHSYKGKTPVIRYTDRKRIVESIKGVDAVVPQSHRDKLKAFHEIGFDVMFVGDDWKGNALFVELENELASLGSKIVYFPYTKSVSSTKLSTVIQKIFDEDLSL